MESVVEIQAPMPAAGDAEVNQVEERENKRHGAGGRHVEARAIEKARSPPGENDGKPNWFDRMEQSWTTLESGQRRQPPNDFLPDTSQPEDVPCAIIVEPAGVNQYVLAFGHLSGGDHCVWPD